MKTGAPLLLVLIVSLHAHAETEPAAPSSTASEATAPPPAAHANCLQYTGSRIQRSGSSGQACIKAPGTVVTREQIEHSGAMTLSDALRRTTAIIR